MSSELEGTTIINTSTEKERECPSELQAKKCVYDFFSHNCTDCCKESGYSVEICPSEKWKYENEYLIYMYLAYIYLCIESMVKENKIYLISSNVVTCGNVYNFIQYF